MTQPRDEMRNDPIVIWGAGAIGGTIGAFLSIDSGSESFSASFSAQ